MREVKAFIFDLDGVITDTAEFHYLAWKQLGEKIGVPFDREFNETLKGVSRMDSLERILEKGNRQNDFTASEKEELAYEKNENYKKLIETVSPSDILPGIEDLLKELREKGYKIALASASKNAIPVLTSLELLSYFDHVVDAATVANSKPHPEVFLRAAEAVNVLPEVCIGVEDAQAGVEAIKSAGMYAIGVGSIESLEKADHIVSQTSELSLSTILNEYLK